jgi:flagellin
MRINHNIAALNTYRQLSVNNENGSKAIEKLSSGLRINRAGDDAAGLAISEKMRAQIRGLDMASKNAQDGVSLIQTAEGALNETHSILQRMRELAVQAANDTNNNTDRAQLQEEVNALIDEIDRIANATEFNSMKLLDGSLSKGLTGTFTNVTYAASVKIVSLGNLNLNDSVSVTQKLTYAAESSGGANDGAFEKIDFTFAIGSDNATATFTLAELNAGTTSKTIDIGSDGVKLQIEVKDVAALIASKGNGAGSESTADSLTVSEASLTFHIGANSGQNLHLSIDAMSAAALNVSTIDITTQTSADAAITTIQTAIDTVSTQRAKLGATQNRLEHTIANLGTASENLSAAESRIRDVDMAKEIMEFTKTSILTQAAQAMLAQANQQPQGVLQLLK